MADQEPDYTRADVYELAWSRPVKELTSLFLMSGRGIAKVCAAHAIPVPGRGDWQKIVAGLEVKRAPLPETSELRADRVVFGGREIVRRRNRTPGSSPLQVRRVTHRKRSEKPAKAAERTLPVVPENKAWAGPKQPTINVLAAISD